MKKLDYLVIAAALSCAAACSHEHLVPETDRTPSGLPTMVFRASADDLGKTSLTENYSVAWSVGEKISVFSSSVNNEFTATAYDPVENVATFEGHAETSSIYYALYPYSSDAKIEGSVISAKYPSVQNVVKNNYDPAAALTVAVSNTNEFQFKQVGALIGFNVLNDGITQLEFSADQPFAGKVKITVSDSALPSVEVVEGAGVTLQGELEAGSTYYLSVLPGQYTGIKVTAEDADGRVCTLTNSQALSVGRGQIVNINSINFVNWRSSYTLNGYDEVKAFIDGKGAEREDVNNLTITGHDVTSEQLGKISERVKSVNGTLTVDGACYDEGANEFWNYGPYGLLKNIDLNGSIVFRNVRGIINPNAISERADFYKVINGDFIVENCPQWIMDWGAESGLAVVHEVKGSLIIRNSSSGTNADSFYSLEKVGGDLIIANIPRNISRGFLSSLLSVSGDLDLSGLYGWFKLEKLTEVGGSFRLHDCSEAIFREVWDGVPALTTVGGDFELRNLTADNYLLFPELAKVGGNFTIDAVAANSFNHSSTRLMFDKLTSVGKDFSIKNIGSGTLYLRFAGLGSIGGDLSLDAVTSDIFLHTETREFMPSLSTVTGSVTLQNFVGSMSLDDGNGANYDSMRIFKNLKTVGGNFVVNNMVGVKRFCNTIDVSSSMMLESIGGDLIITNNPAFKSFNGFQKLTRLGGNVTVTGNNGSWVIQSTNNLNIGFCILKGYRNSGVLSSSAVVNIPVDWNSLTSCDNEF